jgi:hypothetical protein
MATQPRFDLPQRLAAWRQALTQSAAFTPEAAEELEAHLRDSIDRLRTAGLTDEEAFLVAVRRLGNADDIETEFAKVNPWPVAAWRGFWMLAGLLAWLAASCVSGILGSAAMWGAQQLPWDIDGYRLGGLGALVSLAAFAGSLFVVWRFVRMPGAMPATGREWLLTRRWQIGIAVVLTLIGLTVARQGMTALLVRSMPPPKLGLVATVQSGFGALAGLAWPAVLVVLLGLLYRHRQRASSAALLALVLGGLGLFTVGCGRSAAPPAQGASATAPGTQYTAMAQLVGKALVKLAAVPPSG